MGPGIGRVRGWIANFADYDASYGALGGAIAFAIWLWISNLALLFGMALDLELESPTGAPVRPAEARVKG